MAKSLMSLLPLEQDQMQTEQSIVQQLHLDRLLLVVANSLFHLRLFSST